MYKRSKCNPDFLRTIVSVQACEEKDPKPYYLVIYRWTKEGLGPENFVLPQHGNATRPTTSAYYRKDPKLLAEIDGFLEKGMSTDQVYSTIANRKEATVSQTVCGPKMIDNRKLASKKTVENNKQQDLRSEAEVLVSSLRTVPMFNSVTFNKDQYVSVNLLPNMLNDLYRFCVVGNSILRIDTTFELVDGLWLTDTTYTNEALVDLKGKHPEFPGPSFWHFRKTRESYRRFAGELVIQKPELLGLKKIGHDLDRAISNGFGDIFQGAKKLHCTQHMQKRDAFKLQSMGCNQKSKMSIMADIYGSQNAVLFQTGLADAADEEDFDIKFQSLESVWKRKVTGFHDRFQRNRSQQCKDCLVMSSKEAEVLREVSSVTEELQNWAQDFFNEEVRAVRGLGKYRLALGYDHFLVDPIKWNRWGLERQAQHISSFRQFIAKSYDSYSKPSSAGHKASPAGTKRRAELPEPELFGDRSADLTPPAKKLTPLRLSKVAGGSEWPVRHVYLLTVHA